MGSSSTRWSPSCRAGTSSLPSSMGDALADAATAAAVTPPATAPPAGQTTTVPSESEAGDDGSGINLTPCSWSCCLAAACSSSAGRPGIGGPGQGRGGPCRPAQPRREPRAAATDEALKDATNDVEFAAAQWGDAEVAAYRDAIAQASAELKAAFSLRHLLDDAEPDAPPERDRMLQEILKRTETARKLLDEQEQRFDQLRDLERTAPQQLQAIAPVIDSLRARQAAAKALGSRLASDMWRPPRAPCPATYRGRQGDRLGGR